MNFRAVDDTSRQVIDIAVGILIGLRGCSRREAFDELVRVVHQTGVGLGSLAAGLVAVATGSSSADHAEAFAAWGELLGPRHRAALSATA
ncbi:MAG: ANTAR domain-containing protein [Mycolicibacterium rufum]|uniref:ANTAR domain protein n=1 Tax=Mycolicibacterium chlorophenolicum TaxID=37916 RepID=A0A0J6ZGJ7_9MYCO|nr:ANTAR domain-containing protein [Mycolicibacterium chlorophenolicum]KMO83956.1 ANTAR domain protein [Mycolicibacterium chlorophenolicum]MBI5339173.1 ANTAR domain-containing protein [Mycolicibacterium rufum]